MQMAHDVFISYAENDKDAADAICHYLEHSGIRCWIAPRDVNAGVDWADSISQAVYAATALVVVFSEKVFESRHVKSEVRAAFDNQKPIIPIRMVPVKPTAGYDYLLGGSHWIDAFPPPLNQHLDDIARKLNALLARPGAEQTLRKPETPAPKPAPPTVSRWFKFGALGAIPALLLAYVLVTTPSWRILSFLETPSQTVKGEVSERQFLIGSWRSRQMEIGRDTLIYWTIRADGTTSYDVYQDGQKVAVDPSTWTYSNGLFYEEFGLGSTGRALVRATGPDSFELTIVDNDQAEYRGMKRNYTRVKR
jgi:hypothetical protein